MSLFDTHYDGDRFGRHIVLDAENSCFSPKTYMVGMLFCFHGCRIAFGLSFTNATTPPNHYERDPAIGGRDHRHGLWTGDPPSSVSGTQGRLPGSGRVPGDLPPDRGVPQTGPGRVSGPVHLFCPSR